MKVSFIPSSKEVELTVPRPKPASAYLPKWYRDTRMYAGDSGLQVNFDGKVNTTVKSCGPFADALRTGWIQESWCDLSIHYDAGMDAVHYHTSRQPEMVGTRQEASLPIAEAVYRVEFTFRMPWIPRLPKGYSMMYVLPLNHFDLPIVMPSGIVDSDVFYHASFGNVPFYIKAGYNGIIPAGTPFIQMIPVKREEWDSETVPYDDDAQRTRDSVIHTSFTGVYRKMFQQRKEYR